MGTLRKINNWLHDLLLTDYVISRNKLLTWIIYKVDNESKAARVFGVTFLLSKNGKDLFTRELREAKRCNKLKALLLLYFIKRKNVPQMMYQLVKLKDAPFITDLTGLTKN